MLVWAHNFVLSVLEIFVEREKKRILGERIIIRDLTQRWHCVYVYNSSVLVENLLKICKNDNSFKREVIPLKRVETEEWKMEYLINQTRESWEGEREESGPKRFKNSHVPCST